MATGSWLKTHRKQVITHTLIVGAFLLFLFFVSEPLFDRFERVAGESQLYETSIPVETNNITYWIDGLTTDKSRGIDITGWAFINGYDSVNSKIYVVLKSTDRTYVFTTETVLREAVTSHFAELGLDLDYSGFAAFIPARKIAGGTYTVEIYIVKDDVEALQYTGRVVEF
jgi:hypothetical protein